MERALVRDGCETRASPLPVEDRRLFVPTDSLDLSGGQSEPVAEAEIEICWLAFFCSFLTIEALMRYVRSFFDGFWSRSATGIAQAQGGRMIVTQQFWSCSRGHADGCGLSRSFSRFEDF